MASRRSVRAHKNAASSVTPTWVKALAAIILGVGATVYGAFTAFETQRSHDRDIGAIQQMLGEIRGDVKSLLRNQKPEPKFHYIPPYSGQRGTHVTPDLDT